MRTIDGLAAGLRPFVGWFANTRLHALLTGALALLLLIAGLAGGGATADQAFLGFPAMTPFTAGVFILLSGGIVCTLATGRLYQLAAVMLAGAALLIALTGLALSFFDGAISPSFMPSRGVVASLAANALATLALTLNLRRPGFIAFLALAGLAPCLFRIFELLFLFGAPLAESAPLQTMAISTAILQVWFLTSCVLLHPSLGFRRAIAETGLRGRVLRQALPAAFLLPTIAGAFGLVLSAFGGWDDRPFYAVTATLTVLAGVQFIWTAASALGRWQDASNGYAARLARANEALEHYASAAAHDLRAPARHIVAYSQLFEEALKQDDRTAALRYAGVIQKSAAELPVLIEKLLDYARSGYTQIIVDEHGLEQLVEAAIGVQANDVAAAEARIDVAADAVLRCDATLMTVVFQNLIANSLKSRHPERALRIGISAVRETDGWRLDVQDNGLGFEPGFAAVAFNPLSQQARPGSRVGLGLSICRTIIASHGGKIYADPTVDIGARIVIKLPEANLVGRSGIPA